MKRLLSINTLLVLLAAGLGAYVGWEIVRPAAPSATPPKRVVAAAPAQPPAAASTDTVPATGSYGMIASRNLFSPTRSDAPASAAGGAPAVQIPKPNLYGVILRDGAPIAYLEDPVTKRVAGYRVGDTVAGGTLKSIDADRVVLTRPEGAVDVRLHDPARPRAAAVGPPQQPGGQIGVAAPQPVPLPIPGQPGVMPPQPWPAQMQPPQAQQPPQQAGQSGVVQPPGIVPGRRPVPPNLIRRFPQNTPGDASSR